MNRALISLAVMLLDTGLHGQSIPRRYDFTLSGKVNAERSGEALPYASVMMKYSGKGVSTNVDGYYTLFHVPSDTVTLQVRYMGYQTAEVTLEPGLDISAFNITLRESSVALQEVTVTSEDSRNLIKIQTEGVSQVTMRPAQLAALPGIGEKDIFRGLQLLPGISGTNETSSGLYVRGGTPDQNLILYDGFTVYHVDHFYGFFSAFNADAIKDVQVYKGGFGAKYGGKLSSVVDITGKTGNENKVSGSLNVSALSVSGTLEIPVLGMGSLIVSGRRSYTDIIKTGLYNKIYDLYSNTTRTENVGTGRGMAAFGMTQPDFHFYDVNVRFTLKPTENDVVSLSFYCGKDNLDNSLNQDDMSGMFAGLGNRQGSAAGGMTASMDRSDVTNWGNFGVSGKWSRKWGPKLYSNLVVAYSNYFSDRDNFTMTEREQEDTTVVIKNGMIERNDVRDYSLRFDHEYRINETNNLSFGLQATWNDIDYTYTINDTLQAVDNHEDGAFVTAYAQNTTACFNFLSLQYGIRATYFDITEHVYLEPRLSTTIDLTKGFKLKGAWGWYNQFVNRVVRESVLEGSKDFWIMSNGENIPVSAAKHYIAGISWENPSLLVSVEAYYKKMDGLTEYSMRYGRQRFGFAETTEYFFNGDGFARGLEFLFQKKSGRFTGWAGYTLGEVIHTFPDMNLGKSFPALHDQTHELKVIGTYEIGRWQFGATYIYATGKPYTAPVGGYEIIMPNGEVIDYVHVGEKNGFRLPYYARFDLSTTWNFKLGQKISSSIGLTLFNLFNRANVWYREFKIEDDYLYVTDVTTLGFTPNVFVTLKF
jgi:ferric enterobactin receptor